MLNREGCRDAHYTTLANEETQKTILAAASQTRSTMPFTIAYVLLLGLVYLYKTNLRRSTDKSV